MTPTDALEPELSMIYPKSYRHDFYVYHSYFYSYVSSTYTASTSEAAPDEWSVSPLGGATRFRAARLLFQQG